MRRTTWVLALSIVVAALVSVAPVLAAQETCTVVTSSKFIGGKVQSYTRRVCSSVSGGGTNSDVPYDPEQADFDYNSFVEECNRQAERIQIDPRTYCLSGGAGPQPVTDRDVATALRNLPLPPAQLELQPPNGRTLVNFDTNFYTERPAFTRVVRLLGQRITLRIEPASFTWHFGTGESRTTTTPGARYPRLLVTHDYQQEGTFRPRVDTTYSATFRVGGGPWRPVPRSVTIAGPSVALEAVEAQPVLTAP